LDSLFRQCKGELRLAQSHLNAKRKADRRVLWGRTGLVLKWGVAILMAITLSGFWFPDEDNGHKTFWERFARYECPAFSLLEQYVASAIARGKSISFTVVQQELLRDALTLYVEVSKRNWSTAVRNADPIVRILQHLGTEADLPALKALERAIPRWDTAAKSRLRTAISAVERRVQERKENQMLLRPADEQGVPNSELLRPLPYTPEDHPEELLRPHQEGG